MTMSTDASEQPKKRWGRLIALGCGALAALIAVFVAIVFLFVWRATAGPEEVIQGFLASAGAGDYAAAHEHFCAPLKEEQSLADFTATVETNTQLFQVKDTSFTERSIDLAGAELAGTVTLERGTKVPASFKLVKENDDWKLISYNIGS
ncbi:MAG: DUF4878 domain-containing protein [bacterium]|nr:DUF4878 domain-containing protein [bacterium]